MKEVSFHQITHENLNRCLALKISQEQEHFICDNARSLAEAYVNSRLHPYLIFDGREPGPKPKEKPIGFIMLEFPGDGIGFVLRLMIDSEHQGKGYGYAALQEAIRRLRKYPDVTHIATSHHNQNIRMKVLCEKVGFQIWQLDPNKIPPTEQFLIMKGN